MKDKTGNVLYVGKAKDLRKRVASYWRARDVKTFALIQEVHDIEYIVTNTEVESLILEAQLIWQYHPKYNIDLQTPGRYAYIKITDEEYPRLQIARKLEKKGRFIGPFTSAAARNEALRSAYRIFKLCKQRTKKGKPCFRYHLGYCSGACAHAVSPEEYRTAIRFAEKFLRGDFTSLILETRTLMDDASTQQEYERAKVYRDRMLALEKLQEQSVSLPKKYDQDVINGLFLPDVIRMQIFHFSRGIISGRKEYTFDPASIQRNEPAEILEDFIVQYYRSNDVPKEIIVPFKPSGDDALLSSLQRLSNHEVQITVPEKGVKKKLLDLVKKNLLSRYDGGKGQLYALQEILHLGKVPVRIACVDISTLGGTNTVGSLVQFVNGQPWKGGYRRFKIKSVVGINDFAAIRELVSRFAARIHQEKEIAPDLLMIDGGKGQLSSAKKSLAFAGVDIPIIALAKRFEEVYTTWSAHPLSIPPRQAALQLLRAIRDEAHRFAITYQRKRRKLYA